MAFICKPPFPARQFAEYVVFFTPDNSVILDNLQLV
jgi:hypothetical protein